MDNKEQPPVVTTVTKNPNRVEAGKRAYEKHKAKLRETKDEIKSNESTSDNTNDGTTDGTWGYYSGLGIILLVGGGIAAYFYLQKKPTPKIEEAPKPKKKNYM